MKTLIISEQDNISGGRVDGALIGLGIGLVIGASLASVRSNTKSCPKNWEELLKQEREIYYKDGFSQGYEFGYGDGLTVAVTGKKV